MAGVGVRGGNAEQDVMIAESGVPKTRRIGIRGAIHDPLRRISADAAISLRGFFGVEIPDSSRVDHFHYASRPPPKGVSHFSDFADRKRASITAMFRTEPSSGTGNSVP